MFNEEEILLFKKYELAKERKEIFYCSKCKKIYTNPDMNFTTNVCMDCRREQVKLSVRKYRKTV